MGVGYTNNLNWLLQPLLFFNMFLLLLTVIITRLRGLALLFMFLCTILLFAEADITIFKAHLDLIAGFTLFCLFFVALGTYLKKPSNIPGYFLMLVFVISILCTGYTHINKDLWEAQRDVLLAKRDIKTQNTEALAGTLENDWKFGIIKSTYKIVLADDNGKIIKNPKFPVAEGGKVLVYSKTNPTIPKKVDNLFRGLPVYQITDAGFKTQITYWILQANINILKNPDKGVVLDSEEMPEPNRITVKSATNEWKTVEHLKDGDTILVFNKGKDMVNGRWGKWRSDFPPEKWSAYTCGPIEHGHEFKVKTQHGNLGDSVLTIKIFNTI